MFYLYDNLMRQVIQGTTAAINSSCTSAIVSYQGTDTGLFGSGYVPTNDLGLKNEQLYLANYYDDHNFLNGQLAKQSTSQNLSATSSSSKRAIVREHSQEPSAVTLMASSLWLPSIITKKDWWSRQGSRCQTMPCYAKEQLIHSRRSP